MLNSSDTILFQIEYSLGEFFSTTASSFVNVLEKLKESGIEPIMIRKAGFLMPSGDFFINENILTGEN